MAIKRWSPSQIVSRQEKFILGRLKRNGKLYAFLRLHRDQLFDDAFQRELETMYRDNGTGKDPHPPALLAMVVLLQSYAGASDATAVELSLLDLRWQMVLDCLGTVEPLFSQGALFDFRQRLIAADLDRRLLERSRELARETKAFDPKKLPKTLRVAMDSSPLEGAGRVEDTVNLLGHAGRKIVACVAGLLHWTEARVCREAGCPLLLAASVKQGLDLDWSDPDEKATAIPTLIEQLTELEQWVAAHLPDELTRPPLDEHVATLRQIIGQDLEPDPGGSGRLRIRQGVAEDRRVSIEDKEMRHGRKTKSKRFNGYKRHLAIDLDTLLVLAVAVLPANRPEQDAAPSLVADITSQGLTIAALYIDRGYINAPVVDEILARRGRVICRPWLAHNGTHFSKRDFTLNMRDRTITCPAGEQQPIVLGAKVEFPADTCRACSLRGKCTDAGLDRGRSVAIADNELLQHRLRKQAATPQGRRELRERVPIEHRQAHTCRRQGRHARYLGTRKNEFDLRRASAVSNLEVIQRLLEAQSTRAARAVARAA
ncbi:MAG: IS1182 family transposase [Tessaracoccus sp.]|uniref:IS1182 family transposase n=1 Tax=Tessaracoccus sp. TaxID=1971211 RepID=UPI001EB2118D|nr:IS1182 family transposase [Tessaracoccus sp.]MBK7823527.1 IS1182 family transposase [Tessaracoccus sp.]